MRHHHHWQGIAMGDRGASVAMGNFDGVHLGHASVIAAAAERVDALIGPGLAAQARAAATTPAACAYAATVFAAYELARRLPTAEEKNPYATEVLRALEMLEAIRSGEAALLACRSTVDAEKNPMWGGVKTVGDLVTFLHHQDRLG
jgi:hypothetical protein